MLPGPPTTRHASPSHPLPLVPTTQSWSPNHITLVHHTVIQSQQHHPRPPLHPAAPRSHTLGRSVSVVDQRPPYDSSLSACQVCMALCAARAVIMERSPCSCRGCTRMLVGSLPCSMEGTVITVISRCIPLMGPYTCVGTGVWCTSPQLTALSQLTTPHVASPAYAAACSQMRLVHAPTPRPGRPTSKSAIPWLISPAESRDMAQQSHLFVSQRPPSHSSGPCAVHEPHVTPHHTHRCACSALPRAHRSILLLLRIPAPRSSLWHSPAPAHARDKPIGAPAPR